TVIDPIDSTITTAYYWPVGRGFALNTNLLETNSINLGVVPALLAYLGGGVLSNYLENRKRAILGTIRDAEARYTEAMDRLKQARDRLERAKIGADDIRARGISRVQREKQDLVDSADGDLKRSEYSKNATIRFEEHKAIEQVRQQVSRLASERALEASSIRSNNDVQLRVIEHNIGFLRDVVGTNR
uniref:ATP synthase subunit b, chloroplastic n=1 Tax=Megaloselaginella exaltata TaxID=3140882 RepID=A0A7U3TYE1_9TRAC|nr:ATP synthase CF0 subunit I [Selaginella exaltata]